MADQVRWGILSTARIGEIRVIPAVHNSSNGVVAAVASRDQSRAQAFADKNNIPKAHGSYEALLNDPDIDAIYNPLPNSMHAEWSIKAAEAGKPMLCEKPLARDAEEAQQMVDAFVERDLLFAEAFMYRFHPQTDRVRKIISEGGIGDLVSIQAGFSFTVSDAANIRLSKELAGGSLMDVGCYCINVMRLLTGAEPIEAQGFARFGEASQVDESFVGVLKFPGDVLGHFHSGLRAHRVNIYDVKGSEGRLFLEQAFVPEPHSATTIKYWQGDRFEEIQIAESDQYQIMAEDFADALLNKRAPRFPPSDAVANMKVIEHLLDTASY